MHVNTYSELDGPLNPAAPIYVATDPNSPNPILRRQIASKIRDLLEGNGYNPVEKLEAAGYSLTFEVGIDSERVLDYAPVQRPYGGFYGGRYGGHYGWGFGYTTYMPYDRHDVHPLAQDETLRHEERTEDEAGSSPQIARWSGWAKPSVGTDNPELREAVNYLLVGCLEYLGVDTEEWVTVKIKADDPRILGITAE